MTRFKDDCGSDFDDLPMFNRAYARKTDPVTSHEAAEAITPPLNKIEQGIYDALCSFLPDGATSDEIVEASGIQYRTVTPRLKPMCKKGFVIDSGKYKRGDSGRRQIIWTAKGV
tara:strand:+ start:581 stop:922 length:342 start_codon:yes stop_codon:yes gene_type:complete